MIKRTCGSIYALVIALLIVPAVALALIGDRALAAEIPKDFRGTWCTRSNTTLKDDWSAYYSSTEDAIADCLQNNYSIVETTATKVSIPALSVSCVVRQVTKFDACPYGMIFRNREQARARRPFQINPVSSGYHIVLQCMSGSKQSETIGDDWVLERGGSILRGAYRATIGARGIGGASRAPRCQCNIADYGVPARGIITAAEIPQTARVFSTSAAIASISPRRAIAASLLSRRPPRVTSITIMRMAPL